MSNRRQKEKKSTAKPATDTEESNDTVMLDVTASEHFEDYAEAWAVSLPPPTKAKKQKGQAAASRPSRAKRQPAAEPSSILIHSPPGIDNSHLDHPSGDSNGSASPSTRIATPAIIQPTAREPWVPRRPERPFDEYSADEVDGAVSISLIRPRAEDPAYDPKVIICDTP